MVTPAISRFLPPVFMCHKCGRKHFKGKQKYKEHLHLYFELSREEIEEEYGRTIGMAILKVQEIIINDRFTKETVQFINVVMKWIDTNQREPNGDRPHGTGTPELTNLTRL